MNEFRGLRTAIYCTPDLERAKAWYTRVLGTEPYFDEPFYVGFNVAGYELGLVPDDEGASAGPGGTTVYWGVPNAAAAQVRLLDLGARPHEPVQDVGGGILLATVYDPFGNLFGVIENPHFQLPGS